LSKAVVLEQHEILCASGTLKSASKAIIDGKTAVREGPCFDYDVSYAPFPDQTWATLTGAAEELRKITGFNPDIPNLLFVYCAAKGDVSSIENNTDLSGALLHSQARKAAELLGFKPSRIIVVSSACASGAIAVQTAKEMLERGLYTTAAVFGYDVISRFVVSGFYSLNALSAKQARPFDKSRDGLNLGDGAALSIFTYREPRDGDVIVAGAGCSNDANHRTGPSRTGEGLFRAAKAALDDCSGYSPVIGAVKCHGTATVYNDAMEAKALALLFEKIPPCYSLKGAIGHTSGAGSLMEILLASCFMKIGKVPPTAGFQESGVDEPVQVCARGQDFQGNSVLCLSAGFGGVNAAVVLREFKA